MFRKITIAAATLAALSASALAATPRETTEHRHVAPQSWVIIKEASSGDCFVTDRQAQPAEAQIGGSFSSRAAAENAMTTDLVCSAPTASGRFG